MNNIEIMQKLFDMYRFDRAMPDEVRTAALKAKKEILIHVLKSVGKYTVMTALVIQLIFLFKKFGIGMSIAKSYFTVQTIIIVASTSAVVSTGAIIWTHHTGKKTQQSQIARDNKPQDIILPDNPVPVSISKYLIEITPFTCKPELKYETDAFVGKLYQSIRVIKGTQSAVLSHGYGKIRSQYVLTGSFSRLGDLYYINIRVVDAKKSITVSIINKTCDSQGLEDTAAEITETILKLDL